jgi:hypothetical protein
MDMTNEMFTEGQRVRITRGTDRGATGTIRRVVAGQVTLYVVTPDVGQVMNTQSPMVKASSLKAI